ncbi:hypothetical protein ALC56_11404 [Trachymyrmex septentrionalis]|uniref:Uncharacterized protein n=1 Tax=Trachymyrmex septentrionalis TaxID=34720 RepID=A0A195F295_9HYME|nr:hypothetical protein ALC56_11404 [Trachymyrmex septentrionalis]
MSHRNQLMNPGQEMLDDNIEYTTHDFSPPPTPSKRRNVASRELASSTPKLWARWSYLFIGMLVETSFSISVASQAHHDGLCQQLVQRYRGIMEHEDKGTRERTREDRRTWRNLVLVLSIPSRITLSKTACWHEKKRSPTKDDDRITLLPTLQRAIDATKYSELPQILETKTLERDVATAIPMGGRLEIRKNIPRKLTRIRKPAGRCVNQLASNTRDLKVTADKILQMTRVSEIGLCLEVEHKDEEDQANRYPPSVVVCLVQTYATSNILVKKEIPRRFHPVACALARSLAVTDSETLHCLQGRGCSGGGGGDDGGGGGGGSGGVVGAVRHLREIHR